MTGLFDARDSGNLARRLAAPEPPATLGESALSAAEDVHANDLSISTNLLLRDQYERYLDTIEAETGQSIPNPYDVADDAHDFTVIQPNPALARFREQMRLDEVPRFARAKTSAERERELFDELTGLKRDRFPGLTVRRPEEMHVGVRGIRRAFRERRAEVAAREDGLGTEIGYAARAWAKTPASARRRSTCSPWAPAASSSRGSFAAGSRARGVSCARCATSAWPRRRAERDALAYLERQHDLENATPFDRDAAPARAEHERRRPRSRASRSAERRRPRTARLRR